MATNSPSDDTRKEIIAPPMAPKLQLDWGCRRESALNHNVSSGIFRMIITASL